MKIADIKIGNRVRQQVGDLDDLCRSIEEVGLLQPVVVTADGELVAGARRVAAFEKMGRDTIAATVAKNLTDALLLLKAERDENVCRLDFAPSEAVALGEKLERLERPKAKERQREHAGTAPGKKKNTSGKLPEVNGKHKKETRHKVAVAVGMKAKTYGKAKAVVTAAVQNPTRFAEVACEMDRTRNVDAAFREVKRAEREAVRQEAAREAEKIVADDLHGVHRGDFRDVAKTLDGESVDLIFTDPPYDRETLPLYGDMAKVAARVLKPGGSLITYLGQYQIGDVCALVAPHLRLWWTLCCLHTGRSARMTEYGVVVKWKPMLWFVKGTRGDKQTMVDDLVESRREKDAHEWQQGIIEAAYYIDKLTLPGGMVFDPFCGGATTAVAAKQLKRRWLTCDVDKATVALARKRVMEATP